MELLEETPPLARGRLSRTRALRLSDGNTPACAGKTPQCALGLAASGKHPRLRGEDSAYVRLLAVRARNTPACAGKTQPDKSVEAQ